MRTDTARTAKSLVAIALLVGGACAVAGCGSEKADRSGAQVPDSGSALKREVRARQVADAWDGSQAAEVWGKGYYPMGEAVQLPEEGFRTAADQRAFTTQNFALHGDLPGDPHEDGAVQWKSGGSLALPLAGARTAYEALARGVNDGAHLTVTGAKPGEMDLVTSRGPATVPAWLFTLEGYDTPLKRAAVTPSKLPRSPIGAAKDVSTGVLSPLGRLVEVAGGGRSVTVVANHGACDDGPAVDVLETGGSVVLSASVTGTKDGPCSGVLHGEEVTVQLDQPVGDRVLLDAFTARPVPYGRPDGPSPSWS
ncbi:hypothetical protein [Streptomyces sp. NPDC055189]